MTRRSEIDALVKRQQRGIAALKQQIEVWRAMEAFVPDNKAKAALKELQDYIDEYEKNLTTFTLQFTRDEMGMLQGGMDSEHEYWEQRVCDAENAIDEDTDQGLVNAYHTESLVYNQENLDLAHRVRAKIDEVLDDPA